MKILVTGGAGFIGNSVVRTILNQANYEVVNLDKLTYAGNLESLSDVANLQSYCHEQLDICDANALKKAFQQHKPDCVMHLAAESHVDRSIEGPSDFIDTNIFGTFTIFPETKSYT